MMNSSKFGHNNADASFVFLLKRRISRQILSIVLLILLAFTLGLSLEIGATSFSNLTQVTLQELERTSKILSHQITAMEQNANRVVQSIETNPHMAEQITLLTHFGPYFANDLSGLERPLEASEMIYAFQAQLELIQLFLPLQRLNNLASINFYLLSPFDMVPNAEPVLALRLDQESIWVSQFFNKGKHHNRSTRRVTMEQFQAQGSKNFGLSSVYAKSPQEFYEEHAFQPFTPEHWQLFFHEAWQKPDGPYSRIIYNNGSPTIRTWYPVKVPVANPQTWREESTAVAVVMVEQNLDHQRMEKYRNQLGIHVALAQNDELLRSSLDDPEAPGVLGNKGRVDIDGHPFYYSQKPILFANQMVSGLEAIALSPISTLEELTHRVFVQIGLVALFTVLGSTVVIYFAIQRFVNRPLRSLMLGVRRVSEGDLQHKVAVDSTNELGQLANAFNRMSAELDKKISDLQVLNDKNTQMLHLIEDQNEQLMLAQKRTASLRRFSNQIADFQEEPQLLYSALQELCEHIPVTNGILFLDLQQEHFTQLRKYNETCAFLGKPMSFELVKTIFESRSQQVAVVNALAPDHPVYAFYTDSDGTPPKGGHFIYIRASSSEQHVLCLFRQSGNPKFDNSEMEYLDSMLNQINIVHHNISAIRDNTRMESELKTASAVQRALLPKSLPEIENIELAGFFQSASETGGDWYGFITQWEQSLFILIGDVTGHGTPSALVTATACATCRTLEETYQSTGTPLSPAEVLQHLNYAVFQAGAPDYLMTFFAAQIDLHTGQLTFANAAHNFPILVRSNGKTKRLLSRGQRLGYGRDTTFSESTIQLEEGDLLFFFTDGLVENENADGDMWGERKLIRYLTKHRTTPMQETMAMLVQEMYQFWNGHPQEDDVTMVGCRVLHPFTDQG